MTSKIVLPVALVLAVILGILTRQIESRASRAIGGVATRELTALNAATPFAAFWTRHSVKAGRWRVRWRKH